MTGVDATGVCGISSSAHTGKRKHGSERPSGHRLVTRWHAKPGAPPTSSATMPGARSPPERSRTRRARQTLYRATWSHDLGLRRPTFFSVMTGVRP